MKFANLFKKELKELLTPQTIITMLMVFILLSFAGNALGGIVEEAAEEATTITICDRDDTQLTQSLIKALTVSEVDEKTGLPTAYDDSLVKKVEVKGEEYASELERLDIKNVIIIPEGFTESVMNGKEVELINISKMTSGATLSNISNNNAAVESIKEALKQSYLIAQGLSPEQLAAAENLVTVVDKTVVDDKISDISISIVSSLTSMQTMFLPIVVYVLVMYCSQLIISAISSEKLDKTLETLLSAPVSRMTVLSAKMLAAGTVAALNAVIYMLGFNQMMGSMTESTSSAIDTDAILTELGLKFTTSGYILLGIQMFLTILIALSVSLILGALAKDAKSAQTLQMPIMFLAMVPYFLAMLIDIRTLSPVARYLIYAIPFTHTFIASENILYGNMPLFWGGVIYQLLLLVICMTVAVRIFTSDKIFTLTINLGKKSKFNKKKKGIFSK